MRLVVTGGLGVIGSRVTQRLLEAGHDVNIWDACEAPRNEWVASKLLDQGLPLLVMKTRIETVDPKTIAFELEQHKIEAVIHAAASTGIPHSVLHPDDDWRSNVDATRTLLEGLRLHPVPTVILSSVKPYKIAVGAMNPTDKDAKGLTEDVPLEPDEPYAASKAAQSMLAMAYARSYDLPVVTFRCSNLYGPAPCHGPRHGWLTWFAISAAIGRPIEVQGTGEQSRDMLHADDVYSACMLALTNARTLAGKVFNLGGGKDNRVTVSAAAERMRDATGVEITRGPAREMDDDHVFVNTARFLKATGWRPQVGVEDGARDVLRWALENKEALAKIYADPPPAIEQVNPNHLVLG